MRWVVRERLEYAALEYEAAVMEQYIDDVSSVVQVVVKSDLQLLFPQVRKKLLVIDYSTSIGSPFFSFSFFFSLFPVGTGMHQ